MLPKGLRAADWRSGALVLTMQDEAGWLSMESKRKLSCMMIPFKGFMGVSPFAEHEMNFFFKLKN